MNQLISNLRTYSGIVLACYVVQHLINHSMGIVSIDMAEAYRKSVGYLFQNPIGQFLLYASILIHFFIALRAIYLKSSLKMKPWQWFQLILGLSFLPLVAHHVIGTRGYDTLGNIDPNYYNVVSFFAQNTDYLIRIALVLLVVWGHCLIGFHFWLRTRELYRRTIQLWYLVAVLIPTLATVGVFQLLKTAPNWMEDKSFMRQLLAPIRAMPDSDRQLLASLDNQIIAGVFIIVFLTLIMRHIRIWRQSRQGNFTVNCNSGKTFRGNLGLSLLEALRNARVPHVSICGGRARCTTCRVRVGPGIENLEPPNDLEARALAKIAAPDNVRLACQIFPKAELSITPLVEPDLSLEQTLHAGGVQGHEQYVVAMFVDMRGSTSLGERVMAYDVVYVLNQFFVELSESLAETKGHYAQFAGDGLMALYGLDAKDRETAVSQSLEGAAEMFTRINQLNDRLNSEFGENISMGIGIHGGEAIVGTMGPPKTPLLTAVGDNINIAARLESQTKNIGCDLIISRETLENASIKLESAKTLELEVRGRNEKVFVQALKKEALIDQFGTVNKR